MNEGLKKYQNKERIKKFNQNSPDCGHQYFKTVQSDPNSKITHQQVMCRKTEDSCKYSKCPILSSVLYGHNKKKS